MSAVTIESLRRLMEKFPPLDRLELRFNHWDCLPAELQCALFDARGAGLTLTADSMIPPGIVLQRNLTLEEKLTITSTLEEMAAVITIYDLRPVSQRAHD